METPAVVVEAKAKRVLTEDQLEKLGRARELALIKRKEMAAVRKTEKEALVLEKMNVRAERDHKSAEKEASRRLGGPAPVTTAEEVSVTTESEPPTESVEVPVLTKVKRKAVIVETSDSDEEEGMIDNARVFVVKRVAPAPAPPTAPVHVAPIDPHATLYKSMFG